MILDSLRSRMSGRLQISWWFSDRRQRARDLSKDWRCRQMLEILQAEPNMFEPNRTKPWISQETPRVVSKTPPTPLGSLGVLEQSLFSPSFSLPQSDPKPGKTMPGVPPRGGGLGVRPLPGYSAGIRLASGWTSSLAGSGEDFLRNP